MAQGWPVALEHGRVGARPLQRRDALSWSRLRADNVEWLTPWEATLPPGSGTPAASYVGIIGLLRRRAREGRVMPFAITYQGQMVGQLTVNGITRGSMQSANIGYWIARSYAGRGIIPTAVALVSDHLLGPGGLHRVEIAIRPENTASLRVVEKLGFTEIGLAPRYLHIAGHWRDHLLFQVTSEDVPEGLLRRWERGRGSGGDRLTGV